ncbi:MAG: hypothetical protein QXL06_02070 [Nitrososphaerota archaeon]
MAFKEDVIIKKLKDLLPSDLGIMVFIAEEVARETAREITKNVKKEKVIKTTTRSIDFKNEVVNKAFDVIKSELSGRLIELSIRSPSPNFYIMAFSDGKTLIDRSYNELLSLSSSSEIIDAYREAESGVYVFHLKDIKWSNNFIVRIYPSEAITMHNIFAVWEEYVVD